MAVDLSSHSLQELVQLQKDLVAEIPRRMAAEKQRAVEDLKRMAAERGFDLKELVGGAEKSSTKGKRGPAAVKYHSKDGQEWTGRGRKPHWVVDHLAKGGTLEELAA